MKKHLLWLIATILMISPMLTSCAVEDNPATGPVVVTDPVRQALAAIPNIHDVVVLSDSLNYGFSEAYDFFFEQPIDHNNPAAGSFMQRVTVAIRDLNAPTVLWTDGYAMYVPRGKYVRSTDLAENLGANFVEIEHRHFGDSKIPSDTKWDYLTIQQAADDQHAIIQALKPLLPKEWISTGTSKDGMTSLFLRYCYPDDIDVTTVFCSPFMTSLFDTRVGRWMQQESGADDVKPLVDAHINRLLVNGKNGLFGKFCKHFEELVTASGGTYTGYPIEYYVRNIFISIFGLYSYKDAKMRRKELPPIDCSDETLLRYYLPSYYPDDDDSPVLQPGKLYWEDQTSYPYYIQTAKQLGQYAYDYSLVPQLEGTDFDASILNSNPKVSNPSALFDCDVWLYDYYDNSTILDILSNFLPNFSKPILFVYSKSDPWTGARPATINPVAKMVINPDGVHNQDLNNKDHYSAACRQEILDYVSKYVQHPVQANRRAAGQLRTADREFRDYFMIGR